jgi:flagellar hook protein FlgE
MPNSLLTGVSGLLAHQRMLDVVGHNIANMNTHGFKGQRILFADALYETISPASGSGDTTSGGKNPVQVGGGVTVAQTDRNFSQGSVENTGEQFDFAISGDGFFMVTDGQSDFYTRAGSFSLDGEGYLVNPDGMYVKRFSSAGETDGVQPGFQIPGDDRIAVPLGAPIKGVKTDEVSITGNLNAQAEPPRAQKLTAINPFTSSGVPADGTTALNALDSTDPQFVNGDSIIIEGKTHDGNAVSSSLAVDGSTTVQDLLNAIDAAFPGAMARLENGAMVLEATDAGSSELDLNLRNDPANTGQLAFATHKSKILLGKDADIEPTIFTIYDEQGGPHELKASFLKQSDDVWSLEISIDPDEGVMVDGMVSPITFSDEGDLITTGDPTITIQINGIAAAQSIALDFGDALSAVKLTHYDTNSSLVPSASGSPPGVLTNIQMERDGSVKGIGSNGKVFVLAQLAIAKFRNNKGLIAEAGNLYSESLNSGQAEIGSAGGGGRGSIAGSQLESSNVDIGLEFTKLIVAQRGFSANARTITVASEVLEELTNIIR